MATATSYQARIISALATFAPTNPDAKHNVGRLIGEAFLWDEVVKYAKAQSDRAWSTLEKEGHIERPETTGEHALAITPSFAITARVSNPIRRFNPAELANLLHKKYKVPKPVTTELCDQAKMPTKPAVTYVISERS